METYALQPEKGIFRASLRAPLKETPKVSLEPGSPAESLVRFWFRVELGSGLKV